jgi:cation transport ATPase|tara:strand:- start:87 stop:467 length:381 start_codon:yes stop_codon:yes gene_type:complete
MIDIVKQISSIGKIADKFIQTKEEKNAFHKEMTQILIQAEADQQKNVTERWKHDMSSDNMLTKSVRPMVLIFLILCTMLLIFIDSGFITFVVDDEWKDLLKIILMTCIGAYFGGRSYEKANRIKRK